MDDIQKSLEDSIEEESLSAITDNFLEVDIDVWQNVLGDLSNNEAVKNVPILKWLVAFYNTSKTISTLFLMKKIVLFLYQLKDIPVTKRQKFLKRMDGKQKRKIFENLMLVLEKHDNFAKSEILGKLFAAFIREELTQEEFSKLNYATSLINVDSINDLVNFYVRGNDLSVELLYYFGFLQLVDIDSSTIVTSALGGQPRNLRNPLGEKFVEIISGN